MIVIVYIRPMAQLAHAESASDEPSDDTSLDWLWPMARVLPTAALV
jgi:hypothetical protein